jgi:hypothetical protein
VCVLLGNGCVASRCGLSFRFGKIAEDVAPILQIIILLHQSKQLFLNRFFA